MLEYFFDPVLRAPTIGSMLMCLSSALAGVIVFLRKETLLGESLSHATYPGVILGVLITPFFFGDEAVTLSIGVLTGAFCTALIGFFTIHWLQRRVKVHADAALCFVLASFFGIGLTMASRMQFSHASLYRQIQMYLYGQAATMTDVHIYIYGALSLFLIFVIGLLYKELQVMILDRDYAKSLGIGVAWIDAIVFASVVLSLVIGIRSVGVVLMSAMLIAPAVAARQFSHRLSRVFLISGLIGMVSGFLGNVFSLKMGELFERWYPDEKMTFPTGPMIVIVASTIAIISLFLAPERGLLWRIIRMWGFRQKRMQENLLKELWRGGKNAAVPFKEVVEYQPASNITLRFMLWTLQKNGWVVLGPRGYTLTEDGYYRAAHIVRLHRLWEVYLARDLGMGIERVHYNAEEMEHIITPELEKELTELLKDPKEDPHHQPIPPKDKVL